MNKSRKQSPEYKAKCEEYDRRVKFMMSLDADDQDWEFTYCPECGSTLDHCGICRNTWCGNSPDQGEDWV